MQSSGRSLPEVRTERYAHGVNNNAPVIDGVILAAGRSSRMARPKPLLEVGGMTFLERAARTLVAAGCRRRYIVANAGADWVDRAVQLGLDVIVNNEPESEQIESLELAVERLPSDTAAILVLPVDLPLVREDTAAAIAASFRAQPNPLILPFHNGVAGHPVLLGRELFETISAQPLEEGIRSLILLHARHLREVKVVDPGILVDIDTPDDYWRYIENK
jgi:molybdenum cofactor cytidylyltransferase